MDVLGIDVGGSGIKGAIVAGETGELCSDVLQVETPRPATPPAVAEAIGHLVESFPWHGTIGCGFPAVIHSGVAMTAANIDDGWIGCNVEELLEQATGCPCAVINDADAAGLAEVKYGAGRGYVCSVLMLTLGTGIGSALFSAGHLFPNTELGHITVAGMDGEKYASAAVLTREKLDWQAWSSRLNLFLDRVERLCSPQLIILGGGISEQADSFLPYLKSRARLVPAQLQNRAGIVGAAYFASNFQE